MTKRGLAKAAAVVLAIGLGPPVPGQEGEASCRICHPGPTKGLAVTPHAGRSCASCHGDLTGHAELAMEPVANGLPPLPAVTARSCASCHQGRELAPALGAHPWRAAARPGIEAARALPAPNREVLEQLEENERRSDFDWSGLVEFGYRFVHVGGSRARYETDVDLEPGFRLRELDVVGRGGGEALADQLRLRSWGIGDPWWGVELDAEKDDAYRARAGLRRDEIKYFTSGDYHRVDRRTLEHSYDFEVDIAEDLRLFAGFARLERDGFWITNRIGNQNLTPLTAVNGVQSPRRYDSDTFEAGLNGLLGDLSWTLAFEYLDDRSRDRWIFSRPAQANPTFTESEDFRSLSTLRGPGLRWAFALPAGPVHLGATGFYRELDRRIVGDGTATGFDIAEFTTVTDSDSSGGARTTLADWTATVEVSERVALVGDLRWLDHAEELALRQTDVTTFPSLMTSTTVTTNLDQRTAQRKLEGSIALDVGILESLDATLGWGFAREYVKVPDLEIGDQDFRSGTLANDGAILGLEWRPDEHWRLRGRFEDFGQNGVQLHELTEDEARSAEGWLDWRSREDVTLSTFFKHRRSDNDIALHHTEVNSMGFTGTVHREQGLDLLLGYVYSDVDNRTLTNFYFDPDPNPVPTFVGFRGDTHTVTASLLARPDPRVRWELTAAWTKTTGSFDVELLDWRAQVAWEWWEGGELGTEYRQIAYDEQGGLDDYDAQLLFVFFRQTW